MSSGSRQYDQGNTVDSVTKRQGPWPGLTAKVWVEKKATWKGCHAPESDQEMRRELKG